MYTLLLVIIFFACLVLVLSVLAQSAKGGGLSGSFGTASASQFMSVKQTTNVLERITWGAAICIMICSVIANIIVVPDQSDTISSPNIRKAQETTTEDLLDPFSNDSAPLPLDSGLISPDPTTEEQVQ